MKTVEKKFPSWGFYEPYTQVKCKLNLACIFGTCKGNKFKEVDFMANKKVAIGGFVTDKIATQVT